MLQWFQQLMPRQDAFFPAFERHAAVMVKAAVALREMVAGGHVCRVRTSNVAPLQSAQPRQIKSRDKSPNRGVRPGGKHMRLRRTAL